MSIIFDSGVFIFIECWEVAQCYNGLNQEIRWYSLYWGHVHKKLSLNGRNLAFLNTKQFGIVSGWNSSFLEFQSRYALGKKKSIP